MSSAQHRAPPLPLLVEEGREEGRSDYVVGRGHSADHTVLRAYRLPPPRLLAQAPLLGQEGNVFCATSPPASSPPRRGGVARSAGVVRSPSRAGVAGNAGGSAQPESRTGSVQRQGWRETRDEPPLSSHAVLCDPHESRMNPFLRRIARRRSPILCTVAKLRVDTRWLPQARRESVTRLTLSPCVRSSSPRTCEWDAVPSQQAFESNRVGDHVHDAHDITPTG